MTDKPLRPMLPQRHQPTLFSLDISSIALKDARQHLEFPFFTLSKKPDLSSLDYKDQNGNSLEVSPHSKGLPTIYDKDFLIYAVSVVMDRLNRGEPASRRLRMYAADMLEFANRTTGGKDYKSLENALLRLSGCRIKTNIRAGDTYITSIFGLIESGDLVRKYGWDGRLQHVDITLSEWLWAAVEARQVLTLHPDYFRLRRPIERRVYEVARKFCGRQAEWRCGLANLREKCGVKSSLRRFRQTVRRLAAEGDLLDYSAAYDGAGDIVVFRRQEGSMVDQIPSVRPAPPEALPESAAAEARRRHGEDIDLAAAERDWRSWMNRKGIRPTNPAALFLSFLDRWADRLPDGPDSPEPDRPDWIQEMADEWWAALTEKERQAWREHVGERTELDSGEGWFRSEESLARMAFDARWRRRTSWDGRTEPPPPLLARAAARAGGKASAAEIGQGWKKWIAAQPDWMRDSWMFSLLSYADSLAAAGDDTDTEMRG